MEKKFPQKQLKPKMVLFKRSENNLFKSFVKCYLFPFGRVLGAFIKLKSFICLWTKQHENSFTEHPTLLKVFELYWSLKTYDLPSTDVTMEAWHTHPLRGGGFESLLKLDFIIFYPLGNVSLAGPLCRFSITDFP